MIWLLLVPLAAALLWWGANVVFYPPDMLKEMSRPEDSGIPYEKVSFKTPDGLTLRGWLIAADAPTDRTVLLCHGWGDNKGDVLVRLHELRRLFNLFLFDSRAHGESEGKITTIGCLESLDFAAALKFLRENRPAWARRLGVYGLSMGAAMAIYGMAHDPEIRCAVFEAPFRSFNQVVAQFSWNRYRFPYYPIPWLVLWTIRLRLGRDPEPYSPIYHIGKLAPRPVFFIAGSRDRLMPLEEVQALHRAARPPKDIWVIGGATHGRCQEVAGPEYAQRIGAFFDRNL